MVSAIMSRETLVPAPQPVSFPAPPTSIAPQPPLPIQQLSLTTFPQPALGNTIFPPTEQTSAGATIPPLAAFGGAFLSSVLPTNQAPQVTSPLSQVSTMIPGLPTAPGSNAFSARYAPQIYAVFLNGLVAGQLVSSTALETNLVTTDIARPPISGDPGAAIPGLPPVTPVPAPEGTGQVIASLTPLAGSGTIFSDGSATAPTPPPPPAPAPKPEPAPKPAPAPAAKAA